MAVVAATGIRVGRQFQRVVESPLSRSPFGGMMFLFGRAQGSDHGGQRRNAGR